MAVQPWHLVTCYACHGEGRDYDPRDPRDPIEGNKMRGLLPCLVCEGTGKVGATRVMAHLRWCLKEYGGRVWPRR